MNATVALPGSYFIRIQGVPDLVVTAVGGKTRLVWRNLNDPNQLWTVSKVQFSTGGLYVFYNQGAPGGLNAPSYGDNLTLSGAGAVWYVGGDLNGFNVIRLAEDDGFNLNALGGWPADVGTAVGVWNWSGGNPNELWQIIRSDTFPHPTPNWVQVGSDYGIGAVAVDHAANHPPISVATQSIGDRTVFDKIDSPGHGFALRNRFHGHYLHYTGPNQPLGWASPMSLRCLWTAVPNGDYGFAIRPFLDATQNITFIGGKTAGNQIGTADWGGSKDSNQWLRFDDVNARLADTGR